MNDERYIKQIRLKGVGESGQQKLSQAAVLVIGAGGLGCPVIQYLSAAGIGRLGIIDFDKVSSSNLHRQILYTTADIGKLKTEVAERKAKEFNPEIVVEVYNTKAGQDNLLDIIKNYDIIIDACDSVILRYQLSDACELISKPIVYGAIYEYEGQVGMFGPLKNGQYLGYRDLFPYHEKMKHIADCNNNGVLPVLPGIIGIYQANEAIKYLLDYGDCLMHQVMMVDLLRNSSSTFQLTASNDSRPHSKIEFEQWRYENNSCTTVGIINTPAEQFDELISRKQVLIVDVRELSEQPRLKKAPLINIPLAQLAEQENKLHGYSSVLFICQSGKRSLQAAEWFMSRQPEKKIYNLMNGVNALIN